MTTRRPGCRSAWATSGMRWVAFQCALLAVMALGAFAFYTQFTQGLIVTGMRTIGGGGAPWGLYIAFDVFFIGVSFAGIAVAATHPPLRHRGAGAAGPDRRAAHHRLPGAGRDGDPRRPGAAARGAAQPAQVRAPAVALLRHLHHGGRRLPLRQPRLLLPRRPRRRRTTAPSGPALRPALPDLGLAASRDTPPSAAATTTPASGCRCSSCRCW